MAEVTTTIQCLANIYNGDKIYTDSKRRFLGGKLISYTEEEDMGIDSGLVQTEGIANSAVTDDKIDSVSVGKLIAGTISVVANVGSLSGTAGIKIDGEKNRITVNDGTNDRVLIGKLAGKF